MQTRFSLRARIYLILALIAAITAAGGYVMVWYTYRMDALLATIITKNIAAYQTAETLETALVNQKGFVSYYFLDGDPDWLRQLGEYRQIFLQTLKEARATAQNPEQLQAITAIETEYGRYVSAKDQVIDHYREGLREAGARLHRQVRGNFFRLLGLCENYKALHTQQIKRTRAASQAQAQNLRVTAVSSMGLALLMVLLLAFILAKHILGPVRELMREADRESRPPPPGNEIKALSLKVRGLIENVDQTQSELEKSREHLLQTEKMAMVGKLAAGMAHSIRNPLTSVKMRLFSLDRTLALSETQRDDFKVISEEIDQIDTIVQNFLEFSRPPKLKMQQVSPSEVVDLVVQLLRHRLASNEVKISVERLRPLPEIQADPEQLKEVLVNLVVNACEAMTAGGAIRITEELQRSDNRQQVVIRLQDEGPGIPEALRDRVFQPFFTTKEEGTGLGLSIAARIIEEHGGWLSLNSREGQGTAFTITLPAQTG
ncbi:MAG: ATP-binding protein [Desulfobacterales bacterium]